MLGGSGRSSRGKEVQVRFHRTADGKVDPTGGEREGSTLAERRYQLSVKYNSDVCFLLGTASVVRGPDPATDPKYEFCDPVRASRALLRCWDPVHGT